MADTFIRNPIIRGFNPDPSICRVGDDYYVACSTFEYFPGIQIHHSRDLRHWRLLTRALDSVELLDLRGVENSCGVWAPQLTHDGERFYLIFANVSSVGGAVTDSPNYLVTAERIEGPWSNPVYLRSGGFDPSIFHDIDGRKYYVNMQMGEPGAGPRFDGVWLQEYDPDEKRLVGKLRKIWSGTERGITEGPHLYTKDGFYYLLTAEGGTSWRHAVSIARSRNIQGAYETMPGNPLLTSDDNRTLPIQAAGHGDIVRTQKGDYYLVHLAQRPAGTRMVNGEERRIVPLGRESCIQKLEWPPQEWPRLASGGHWPSLDVPAPDLPVHPFSSASEREEFDGPAPGVDFVTLREPLSPEWARFDRRPGCLSLRGRESLNSCFRQSWLGRRVQSLRIEAETFLHFLPDSFRETAGLVLYYDRINFLYLRVAGSDNGRARVGVVASENGVVTRYDAMAFPARNNGIGLRVRSDGSAYRFSFAVAEEGWREAGPEFPITLLGDNASILGGFTGTMVGVCAQAVSGLECWADFEFFSYRELD